MSRFVYGAVVSVLTLLGGLVLGFAVGERVFDLIPGHSLENPQLLYTLLAALPAFAGLGIGSAAWGILMGRLAHAPSRRRMAIAGIVGFAPITLVLGLALGILEPVLVERIGAQLPIHGIFTLLFVPSAFLIAGVSAYALGVGLRDYALAPKLFWRIGLVSGLTFLAVNLTMQALGWQVGGPGAAERATMLTVLFVGNLAAALVAGGVLGVMLGARVTAPSPEASVA